MTSRLEGGYTLLFSVLTAGMVLAMAVFIVNVSSKQFELSVTARNSIYSFYGADSVLECAVSPVNWIVQFASTTGGTLACGGSLLVLAPISPAQVTGISIAADPNNPIANPVRQLSGYVSLQFTDGSVLTRQCGLLTVTTGVDPVTSQPKTVMDARGYNVCNSSPVAPDTTNVGVVERGLRLTQQGIW